MGRIRRTHELTPSMGSGLVTVCNALFASKLAPTGERISNVGAGLLAKAICQAAQKQIDHGERSFYCLQYERNH
ncbi:hypothetical protein D3C75_1296750 [compost metagenome]